MREPAPRETRVTSSRELTMSSNRPMSVDGTSSSTAWREVQSMSGLRRDRSSRLRFHSSTGGGAGASGAPAAGHWTSEGGAAVIGR